MCIESILSMIEYHFNMRSVIYEFSAHMWRMPDVFHARMHSLWFTDIMHNAIVL